jgi:hypothetical protein
MSKMADGPFAVKTSAESPVRFEVVVNNVQAPPAFVGAHNSEVVVGLPPRPFRAALKASGLPVTRVRGLGAVVDREAFCEWMRQHAKTPTVSVPDDQLDEADKALLAAGFRLTRPVDRRPKMQAKGGKR